MAATGNLDVFKLEGRKALVTGAGRGIGRACAQLLAAAGAEVLAVARSADELESLAAAQAGIEPWVADVTDPAFLSAVAGMEQLDVLVNNVGTNNPQPFLEVEEAVLDQMLSLNVRAAFLVAQAAAKVMAAQGSGSIIHMSSQMGHIGAARRTVIKVPLALGEIAVDLVHPAAAGAFQRANFERGQDERCVL